MNDAEPEISADVAQFLEQCIHTVPHLKCLLFLWETAPSIWTEVEIAVRISIGSETAKRILRDLGEHKLITRRSEMPPSYVFDVLSDSAALLPRVASEYQLYLNAVTRLIYTKRSAAVPSLSTRRSRDG